MENKRFSRLDATGADVPAPLLRSLFHEPLPLSDTTPPAPAFFSTVVHPSSTMFVVEVSK